MTSGILYHAASGMIVSIQKGNIADLEKAVTTGYAMLGLSDGQAAIDYSNSYINSAGAISARLAAAPTITATMAGPGDTVMIGNLPPGCWLRDNNELINVVGTSYQVSSASEGFRVIELAGKYKAPVFQVVFSNLAKTQNQSKTQIDADAEAARSRVITPGSGQAMTYLRKADAAVAFLAGQTLTPAQSQRITDEAARLGVTNQQAAQSLLDTANFWEGIDATIDNIRLTAKKNIDAATSVAAVQTILAGIRWPV